MPFFQLDPLEDRRLLAWGAYPTLIGQPLAATTHIGVTGYGVNIALIDSGVDFSQPYLNGKFWANPGEIAGNNIDDDADGYKDNVNGWDFYRNDATADDENGHGTAMAGIIAANPFAYNGATYAGVAQNARIIPLKVADPSGGYSFAFAQRVEKALQWVEANYQRYNIGIVSMSIWTPLADYNNTYADEVSRLAAKGVFMAAAGNQLDPNTDVSYPAADPNVFGVSVVKANGTFPTDTVNRGPGIDLLAPGDAVPVLLRGGGIGTSALATSYATPYASAAAALIKQIKPSFTPAQIASILKDSGVNVTDTSVGYTFSGRTYKRLNLLAAEDLAYVRGSPAQAPYYRAPFVTNTKIQVEDFDEGGEGVAYHDTEAQNITNRYRPTGVDAERTADKYGGYDVTLAKAGEWMEYTVKVATSGTYQFWLRMASKSRGGEVHFEIDGVNKTGTMLVPKTGAWQSWLAISSIPVSITAGTHIIRLSIDQNNATGNGAGNFNWFFLNTYTAPSRAAASAAYVASPVAMPSYQPARTISELLKDEA